MKNNIKILETTPVLYVKAKSLMPIYFARRMLGKDASKIGAKISACYEKRADRLLEKGLSSSRPRYAMYASVKLYGKAAKYDLMENIALAEKLSKAHERKAGEFKRLSDRFTELTETSQELKEVAPKGGEVKQLAKGMKKYSLRQQAYWLYWAAKEMEDAARVKLGEAIHVNQEKLAVALGYADNALRILTGSLKYGLEQVFYKKIFSITNKSDIRVMEVSDYVKKLGDEVSGKGIIRLDPEAKII